MLAYSIGMGREMEKRVNGLLYLWAAPWLYRWQAGTPFGLLAGKRVVSVL